MKIPEYLGKYRIIHFLGSGNFGAVYHAEDTIIHKDVALKVQNLKGEKGQELIREAQTLFELNHENIVRFFNIEIIENKIVLVMELVKGETLRDLIDREAPLSVEEALQIVKEISKGLSYAHERGIAHGDIKPENILINEDRKIKLADFGLAKILKQSGELSAVAGTPLYMAPEAWKGKISLASDIFGLGCILYELFTKKPPFRGENLEEIKNNIFNAKAPKVPGVSLEVNNLVKSMLEKNPEKRPGANRLLSDINKILRTPELNLMTFQKREKEFTYAYLSEEQINFVKDGSDVIILRGVVGSGKTTALAHKVAYFIKELKHHPNNFLYVTFTSKAVNIFKSLLEKLLEEDTTNAITCTTFHQLGQLILRYGAERLGIPEDFKIISDSEALEILKNITGNINTAKGILREIKKAKGNLLKPNDLERDADSEWKRQVAFCYKKYQEELQRTGKVDFEDLITQPVFLLNENPDIRQDLAERFEFLIIDEFQDINKSIYNLILLLKGSNNKIWVAGDESQSIYRFRGASPMFLNSFIYLYPNASKHFFKTAHRISRNVLDIGLNLLSHNRNLKYPVAPLTSSKEEGAVYIQSFEDETKEAQYVAMKINELKEQGIDYSEIGVIFRTNEYSKYLEDALKKSEIPYTVLEGESFYELPEIKSIQAILSHVSGKYSSSMMEVLLKSLVKIPSNQISKLLNDYDTTGKIGTSNLEEHLKNKITILKQFLDRLSKSYKDSIEEGLSLPSSSLVEEFITFCEENRFATHKSIEIMRDFLYTIKDENFEDIDSVFNYINLMKEIGVTTTKHHGVLLLTAHKAKGLEFPVIFITGLIEGLFPLYNKSIKEADLEEERRLLFVAITRAQKTLFISYPVSYKGEKKEPSRFIRELTKRS